MLRPPQSEKTNAMRTLIFASMILLVVISTGCSSKNISVNASSEDRNIFDPSAESEKGAYIPPRGDEVVPGRSPFINLSTYDWDYRGWLESLSERIADLRLPASAETHVEIHFLAGEDGPAPEVQIECTASPEECSRLAAQMEALPTWPPLPGDYPYQDLVVRLSRVP